MTWGWISALILAGLLSFVGGALYGMQLQINRCKNLGHDRTEERS